MTTAEEALAFSIALLAEMNLEVEGVGPESMIGPSGVDLDSLSVSELAFRIEERFGVSFQEDDIEQVAIMTLGEFAEEVAKRAVHAQPEGASG
jgi:acyl carrier protein